MRQMLLMLHAAITGNFRRPSLVFIWILIFQCCFGLKTSAQVCDANAGSITPTVNSICVEGNFATLTANLDGNQVIPSGYTTTYLLTTGANSVILEFNGSPQFTVSTEGLYTIHTLVFDPSTFDLNTIIFDVTTINDLNIQFEQGGGDICAGLDLIGGDILTEKAIAIIIFTTNENCDDMDGSASIGPVSNLFVWPDGFTGTERFDLADGTYSVTATQNTGLGCTTILDVTVGENCGPSSCPTANAGNLTADATPVCLDNLSVTISASPDGNAIVPTGFITTYLQAVNGTVVTVSSFSSFTVFNINDYTIHTLVHDPLTLPASSIIPGTTSIQDVNTQLEQAGGSLCGALDVSGAAISVIGCVMPCMEPQLLNIIKTESNCGQSTGAATVNVVGNTSDYNFSFGGGNISGNSVSGLSAGTWPVTITDVNDPACFIVENFTIGNADGPDVTIISTSPTSCNASNGTAQLDPANFDYVWCDGGTGNTRNGLSGGICPVTVTDPATGCINVIEVDIPVDDQLEVSAIINQQPNCNSSDGVVVISVNFGSNDYTYTWSDDPNIDNAIRNNLSAGTYGVTVVDNGPNGCVGETTFALLENTTSSGSITISNPDVLVNCPGDANGNVQYTVNQDPGFIQPPSEQIVDASGNVYSNGSLPVGDYCIEVTDGSGCLAIAECFSVSEPDAIVVDISTFATTCTQGGSIILEVTGGDGNYNFNWGDIAGGNNPQNRTDLMAGNYDLVVSDGNGCIVTVNNINIVDGCSGCQATTGSLTINASPLIFDGINPVQISASQTSNPNIPPGYSVIYILTTGTGLEVVSTSTMPSFMVNALGSYIIHTLVYDPIVLNPTLYTNGLDLNADLLQGGGTICAALDVAGASALVIPDGNCSTPIIEDIVVIEATCGNDDGLATITMADAATYDFQWSAGGSSNNIATGLGAGTYTVTITNTANPTCVLEHCFVVGNADGPIMTIFSQTPTSCATNNGTAVLEPQTNLFDWSDGTMGAIRTDLAPGKNVVTVTDPGTGCINVFEIIIESQNNLSIALDNIQQPSCGSNNGSLDVLVTMGSTNYSYNWSDIGNGPSTRSNLSAGTYGLTVTDNGPNACVDSIYFVLANTVAGGATANISNAQQETCPGEADGFVDYSANLSPGFMMPSTERIVDANGVEYSNGSLPPGNYCVEILDATNCVAGGDCFEILAAPLLLVHIEVDPVTCTSQGEIRVKPFGGTGLYNFGWDDLTGSGDPQDRTNLAAGVYIVTVTDANGCEAIAEVLVQDQCTTCPTSSEEFLTLPVQTIDSIPFIIESCFDASQTTFALLDGTTTGSSIYGSWIVNSNGTLVYTSNNTPGINVDTICIVASFNILNDTTCVIVTVTPECTGQDIIADDLINLTAPDCSTDIEFCLPLSANDIANYTFTDNGDPFDPGTIGCDFDTLVFYNLATFIIDAPSGPYTLNSWEFDGNIFTIDTFQTLGQLADSMDVWDIPGNWMPSGLATLEGGVPNGNYGQLQIEQIGTGISAILDPEISTVNPLGTLITLDTGIHEMIITDLTTGCIDTVTINVECDDCVPFYNGPSTVMASDCDSLFSICIDIPITQLGDIDLDGSPYTGPVAGCAFDTLSNCYNYFSLPGQGSAANGPYNLDLWLKFENGNPAQIANAQFDSIEALVELLNGWDPMGNWVLNGFNICGDGGNGIVYDSLNITQVNTGAFTGLIPDLDIFTTAISMEIDTGLHVLELSNTVTGCTDSFAVQVSCDLTPGLDTLVQVFVSETDTFCFAFTDTIASVNTDLCPTLADGNVAGFAYIPGTNCVEYTGMVLGVDTFCVEFCFTNGTCEEYNIIVEVIPQMPPSGDTIPVQVLINFTEQYCIDTSQFLAPIDTIYNDCETSSGMFSEVSIVPDSTNCIDILGNVIGGLDTACIVICDTLGVCDTTVFLIEIIPPSTDTITEIIQLGMDSTYCVDSTELFGNLVSIDNFCPTQSGTNVDFTVDANTFCVDYTGLEIGQDTACIEICDDLGICDTIIFIVDVVLPFDTLVAVDNDTMTSTIIPVTIDILANDIFSGDCDDLIFGVLDGVDNGTLVINIDCTVTYLAEPGFCGAVDSFTYFISNGTISDTATVTIDVICDNLEVFTGFSPNDDGVNDELIIQGIDNFPDNEVCLFNRWGNEVFRQKGYTNTEAWGGTFEGKDLPDGTYFYIIDDGEGNRYTGWVQLLR